MSVSKAYKDLQEITQSPEYQTYLTALIVYKEECKRWGRLRKAVDPNSEIVTEALQYFMGQQRYKKACSTYQKARTVYEGWRLRRATRELTPKEIMRMLGERIPTTIQDMVKEAQKAQTAASVSDEQFEQIANAAMKHMEERDMKSTKEQFLSSIHSVRDDPTFGDDAPLPE